MSKTKTKYSPADMATLQVIWFFNRMVSGQEDSQLVPWGSIGMTPAERDHMRKIETTVRAEVLPPCMW